MREYAVFYKCLRCDEKDTSHVYVDSWSPNTAMKDLDPVKHQCDDLKGLSQWGVSVPYHVTLLKEHGNGG